jgi:hypothetical protein
MFIYLHIYTHSGGELEKSSTDTKEIKVTGNTRIVRGNFPRSNITNFSNVNVVISNNTTDMAGLENANTPGGTKSTKKVTQWVQCERQNCKKWRKLPAHVNMSTLPEKWYCEMNKWDTERALCGGPEVFTYV